MEAKGRKMLALGIVGMMCAVALIGAAYAAFSGNSIARTYNEDNTVATEYLTLDAANYTAIVNGTEIDFDTYDGNNADEFAFYFNSTSHTPTVLENAIGDTDFTVIQLGTKALTLTNKTTADIDAIDFSVKATNTDDTGNFIFLMKVSVGQTPAEAYVILDDTEKTVILDPSDWLAAANDQAELPSGESAVITVTLYYGYVADCSVPASFIGPVGAAGAGGTDAKISTIAGGPISSVTDVDMGFKVKQHSA